VPKSAAVGDAVIVHVGGLGFVATALIASPPTLRADWRNRYGASLTNVVLIEPPISIGVVRQRLPALAWARYPRSITTPSPEVATEIMRLVEARRKDGVQLESDEDLAVAGLQELRAVALGSARDAAPVREGDVRYRVRSTAIRLYVLARAGRYCEACESPAPFLTPQGAPYLEPHHTTRLADNGPDHPAHVIGLCPNCHRRAHYSEDAAAFAEHIRARLAVLEPEATA
jgi:hypothetical protein